MSDMDLERGYVRRLGKKFRPYDEISDDDISKIIDGTYNEENNDSEDENNSENGE